MRLPIEVERSQQIVTGSWLVGGNDGIRTILAIFTIPAIPAVFSINAIPAVFAVNAIPAVLPILAVLSVFAILAVLSVFAVLTTFARLSVHAIPTILATFAARSINAIHTVLAVTAGTISYFIQTGRHASKPAGDQRTRGIHSLRQFFNAPFDACRLHGDHLPHPRKRPNAFFDACQLPGDHLCRRCKPPQDSTVASYATIDRGYLLPDAVDRLA